MPWVNYCFKAVVLFRSQVINQGLVTPVGKIRLNKTPENLSGSMAGTIPQRRPFCGTDHRGIPQS